MVDCDLVQGWDILLLHLTNDESLDLGELPVVSETEDCCPIFSGCLVDRVYTVDDGRVTRELVIEADVQRLKYSRVIKHPEETRKVVDSHALEDARISVRAPRPLSCAISCELFPKHGRLALEEKAGVRHTFSETCGVLWRARTYGHGKARFRPGFANGWVSNWTIFDRRSRWETYQKYYVAPVDVVLSVPAITLESRLVHGEIRPISVSGVTRSRDAGIRWPLVWWGGN